MCSLHDDEAVTMLSRDPDIVPFLDLTAMNDEVAGEIDARWSELRATSSFIGGEAVERFEDEWAGYCGTKHAVGVANGTDALALILRALGIGHGDEVVVPANTFVATAEAVLLAGATPRFVDVDPNSLLVSAETLEAALTRRTAAIIVVHLYGQMPDMDAISKIAERAGIALVEDAAQAHGATWKGKRAASFARAGSFSFYPAKNLGAFGDAGAVVTDDAHLASAVRSLGDHGRSSASKHLHPLAGVNSRLDAVQAAVLSAKLPHLDRWNEARRGSVAAYRDLLQHADVRVLQGESGAHSACHLEVVRVARRDEVRRALEQHGVQTGLHYPVPCHEQEAYAAFGLEPLPVVEQAAAAILSLPLFPHLTRTQVERVCSALTEAVEDLVAHAS